MPLLGDIILLGFLINCSACVMQMNKNHSGSASTHQVLYYTAGGNPFLILIDPSSGRLLEAAFVLFLSAGTACRVWVHGVPLAFRKKKNKCFAVDLSYVPRCIVLGYALICRDGKSHILHPAFNGNKLNFVLKLADESRIYLWKLLLFCKKKKKLI